MAGNAANKYRKNNWAMRAARSACLGFVAFWCFGICNSVHAEPKPWQILLSRADSLQKAQKWDSAFTVGWAALRSADTLYGDLDTNLAFIWYRLGIYQTSISQDSSEVYFRKSLHIWESIEDPNPRNYTRTLNNLGILVQRDGRYLEARRFLQRALDLKLEYLPPFDLDLAKAWFNFSTLYIHVGQYADADRALDEAYKIWQVTPSGDTVAYLLNRSAVYFEQFRYPECIEVTNRFLAMAWPVGHVSGIARATVTLAQAHEALGDVESADSILATALEFCDSRPPESIDYPGREAVIELRLRSAEIKLVLGQYDLARSLVDSVERETHAILPARHATYHGIFELRGEIALASGDLESARVHFREACAFGDSVLGSSHPKQVTAYRSLAATELRLEHPDAALTDAKNAVRIADENLPALIASVGEQEALQYADDAAKVVSVYLEALRNIPDARAEEFSYAINLILRAKCQTTDLLIQRRRDLLDESDTTYAQLVERRRYAAEQLSAHVLNGNQEAGVDEIARATDSLRLEYQRLSAGLASRHSGSRDRLKSWTITSSAISRALQEDAVVLDYFPFKLSDSPSEAYALLVIDAHSAQLRWIPSARYVDSLVASYQSHMGAIASQEFLPTDQNLSEYRELSGALYREILGPVSNVLKGKSALFISPGGRINSVSFAGLCESDGRYLVESFDIHYLDAARELVTEPGGGVDGDAAFALADPDFDGTELSRTDSASLEYTSSKRTAAGIALRGGCKSQLDSVFESVVGTRQEVDAVQSSWKATRIRSTILIGSEATEDNFKRLAPGHCLLHIATHGYYLSGECDSKTQKPLRGVQNHPLLSSGLLLANARRSISHPSQVRGEDGILTALEVAEMDFSGTSCVTLSACGTALGEVRGSEGVYGLRRAFMLAGVESVVASLWNVPDEATASLVSEVYAHREASLTQAVRIAQIHSIQKLRESGLADHPFTWAAFAPFGAYRGSW